MSTLPPRSSRSGPKAVSPGTHSQEPKTGDLLKTLAALDEPRLIRDFLGDVMVKDASVDPGESVAASLPEARLGTFQRELLAVMKSTNLETMERNVRLLEQICAARPRKERGMGRALPVLAPELVAAIEAIDRETSTYDWRSRQVEPAEVLAGLARSLIVTEQSELLSRVVAHALALPKKYPLTERAHGGPGEPPALAQEECQEALRRP